MTALELLCRLEAHVCSSLASTFVLANCIPARSTRKPRPHCAMTAARGLLPAEDALCAQSQLALLALTLALLRSCSAHATITLISADWELSI